MSTIEKNQKCKMQTKVIIITGTPCTGKTIYSKKLAKKLSYDYLDANKIIKAEKLYESYDRKNKCFVVDIKKLNKFLIKLIQKKSKEKIKSKSQKENKTKERSKSRRIIIDFHLSHYLPSKYVDKCIVMRCDPKILRKRLEKRGYSKRKVEENLQAEIMEICLQEAVKEGHKPVVVYSK